jgi:hypothetical protein
MNHLRSNKDIRETKRTGSRTHRSDRKTGTITDHDGRRTRGVRRSDKRKDTRIRSSVVRGTRVGDPLGADGRCQPHSAEGLRQGSLIPPRPRRTGRRMWTPGRRVGGSTHDQGRRLVRGTRPPSLTLVGPHGDTPGPRVGEGRPGRTSGKRSERGGWSLGGHPTTPTTPTTTSSAAPTPPSNPARPGGRSTKERGRRQGGGRWWGRDECVRGRRRRRGRGRCVVAPGELL